MTDAPSLKIFAPHKKLIVCNTDQNKKRKLDAYNSTLLNSNKYPCQSASIRGSTNRDEIARVQERRIRIVFLLLLSLSFVEVIH